MRIFGDNKSSDAKMHSIEVMQDVKSYWDGLRKGDPVPYRSDVDPRSIQKVLKHAFILERIAPGMARLRVSCNTLTDVMGMDMRGMPMSALINDSSRDSFGESLEKVFDAPAIGRLELVASRGFGRSNLHAEMMLLPLRSDGGEVNRILGAITCDGSAGAAPHRFDIEGSFLRRIDTPNADTPLFQSASLRPQKLTLTKPQSDNPIKQLIAAQRAAGADKSGAELAKDPAQTGRAQSGPRLIPTRHAHLRVVATDA